AALAGRAAPRRSACAPGALADCRRPCTAGRLVKGDAPMFHLSWLYAWLLLVGGLLPGRPRRGADRRERARPRVEPLEGRCVPSTLTVLNNLDSGPGSLRAAIAAATSGDTINFANSLKGQTITLASGQLAITTNLDIEGLGANKLAVSGNGASRIFAVDSGVTATVAGLTLANGVDSIL